MAQVDTHNPRSPPTSGHVRRDRGGRNTGPHPKEEQLLLRRKRLHVFVLHTGLGTLSFTPDTWSSPSLWTLEQSLRLRSGVGYGGLSLGRKIVLGVD